MTLVWSLRQAARRARLVLKPVALLVVFNLGCGPNQETQQRNYRELLIGKWSARGELEEEKLSSSPAGRYFGDAIRGHFSDGFETIQYHRDGTVSIRSRLFPDDVETCHWYIHSVRGSSATVVFADAETSRERMITFDGNDVYWLQAIPSDERIKRIVYERLPDDTDLTPNLPADRFEFAPNEPSVRGTNE